MHGMPGPCRALPSQLALPNGLLYRAVSPAARRYLPALVGAWATAFAASAVGLSSSATDKRL